MKVFNNKPMHIISYCFAMAQAVSCQPFTLEAWVWPQKSPCGIVVDKLSLEQGLFRYFSFPLPLSYPQCSILVHLSICSIWQLRASLKNILKTHYLSACLKVCGLTCLWLPLFAYLFLVYYVKNSLWNNSATNGQICMKFDIYVFLEKPLRNLKFY
jgi:hypothetical protein